MTTPQDPTSEWFEPVEGPDISHIEIEDDTPVDNIYSEKQQRLLVEVLYNAWKPRDADGLPRKFMVASNVGLFWSPHESPVVPDMLLSLDVEVHPDMAREKRHQTYFIWEFGKPPDIVVEVVSNKRGGELGKRKAGHAKARVAYYVVWDPERYLGERELMSYMLAGSKFIPMTNPEFTDLGLSLRPWHGTFEGYEARWLRWYEGDTLLPTGTERSEAAESEVQRLKALLAAHGLAGD